MIRIARTVIPALLALWLGATSAMAADEEPVWTMGEVRKVDLEQNKVTVRHEEIANLDMPPMSMVFYVEDPALLEGLEEGDMREFYFVEQNGRMMIEAIRESE